MNNVNEPMGKTIFTPTNREGKGAEPIHRGAKPDGIVLASTEDGRRVALHPDGSWSLAEERPVIGETKLDRQPDVRQVCWGMTKRQVKSVEDSQELPSGIEHILGYQTSVSGMDAFVFYEFVDEQLAKVMYSFQQQHSSHNLYLHDYERLKASLSKKYSIPEEDEWVWSNELYRDDPNEYGMAVACGHLNLRAEWKTERTSIMALPFLGAKH